MTKSVLILLCLILFSYRPIIAQVIYHQNIFYGGITCDGYNPNYNNNADTLELQIQPGSSIKKATLFTTIWKNQYTIEPIGKQSIYFNGIPLELNPNAPLVEASPITTSVLTASIEIISNDITSLINPNQLKYPLIPVQNQNEFAINGLYCNFYLYVEYENPALSKINSIIYLNNQDASETVTYLFNDFNTVNLLKDVGFTFNGINFCDNFNDGSLLYLNDSYIGLVGGDEGGEPMCAGVRGAFYYQNDTLYGMDNDTPDPFMNGVDALANIQPYVTDPHSFTFRQDYQTPPGGSETNNITQFFLTYTTPCDTFSVDVPEDTAVCYGSQLQLFANGGQTYQWSSPKGTSTNPAPGLSCFDCPNPVFTADSSMFYTVRIWNNDSCSVVRPVLIKVNPPPTFKDIAITPATCGASDGKITLEAIANAPGYPLYTLNNGTPQYISLFNNLNPGEYTLSITNGLGCKSKDSVVTVGTTNPTQASFTATPLSGTVPFATVLNNNSLFADQFSWFVNQDSVGSPLNTLWLDTVGIYNIELIAWQYDPDCADTFLLSVTALPKDTFSVDIPNIFTINGDGQNDYFSVKITGATQVETLIFNRWGTLVHSSNLPIISGNNTFQLWDGKLNDGKKVAPGVYFYIIKINTNEASDKTFTGTINVVE